MYFKNYFLKGEWKMKDKDSSLEVREGYVDFLKFVGLTAIIIAHINPPNWLFMVRSFDVPLMVILSSLLGRESYKRVASARNAKALDSALRFYSARFKRLVFPTWIFLILYFSLRLLITRTPYTLEYYIDSFCLTKYGIGYVWVILMYLYSALTIPIISRVTTKKTGVLGLTALYILYELAFYYRLGAESKLIDSTFYYLVPYGCVLTYLGYNYKRMHSGKYLVLFVSATIFILIGGYYWNTTGVPQQVQIAKYPPRAYFLSYGIAVSFALMIICERNCVHLFKCRAIQYISAHSMWIYLWHILVLDLYPALRLPDIWYIKFFGVYLLSVGIVFSINSVLDYLESWKKLRIIKYLRG